MKRAQSFSKYFIFLVFLTLFLNIHAAGPVWSQTDWSGGSGQDSLVDSTMYQSDDSMAVYNNPSGELSIAFQVEKGGGTDGDIIISSADSVVNIYTDITTGTTNAGATTLYVTSTSGISAGDEILIIQVQHSSNAGIYEYANVTSVPNGTTIEISAGLQNAYYSGAPDQANASVTQVVRVPHFNSVTINDNSSITCQAWNGTTGGVVAFRVKTFLSLGSSAFVHTDTMGFRGGAVGYNNNEPGTEGEGILGKELALATTVSPYVTYPTGINNGGAGGAGVSHAGGGGGGGGHATVGGIGQPNTATYYTDTAYGGYAVGSADMTKVYMGGGGGGGGDDDARHNGTTFPLGGADGGNGGGIIFVYADSIVGGEFSCDGESKADTDDAGAAEGSGGAGGSIILYARVLNTITMSVDGGEGSNLEPGESGYNSSYGYGGDGSQGRIKVGYANLISTTLGSDVGSQISLGYEDSTAIISSITNYSGQSNVSGPYLVSWNETLNGGSSEMYLRTGTGSADISGSSWTAVTNGAKITPADGIAYNEPFLQYKLVLKSSSGGIATPQFADVSIELNERPGTFSLATPTGTEETITPTLDWADAADNNTNDTVKYIVEVDDDSDFSSLIFRTSELLASTYTIDSSEGIQGHMTYYWRVWAKDTYSDSLISSDTLIFTTENNAPDQFSLLLPVNGSENSVTPTLVWNKPNDIDPLDNSFTYYVELDDNADFSSPLFTTGALTDTTYQVTSADSLKGHMTYYWRVRAIDSYPDTTVSADTFMLTTEDNPPNSFSLVSPASGSENSLTPLLQWNNTSDIDPLDTSFTFVVEVDDNADFSSPLIRTSDLSYTSYQVLAGDNLVDNSTYYWRVWAKDSYPDSTISLDTFVIFTDLNNDIPSLPTPLSPIPNTERSFTDSLGWTRNDIDPGDTLRYNIRIGEDILFGSYVSSKTNWLGDKISISDLDNSNLLEDNKIYYWQVEAHDPDGASSGYTAGTDSIFFNKTNDAPSDPFNLYPTTETAVSTDDYLRWDITDADSLGLTPDVLTYTVIVDNNSDFSSPLGTTTDITYDSIKISDLVNSGSLFDNIQYFWKVRATDNHGLSGNYSDGSANFWFNNSNGAPTIPTSLLPVAGSVVGPTDSITWMASTDSDPYDQITYVIEISLVSGFTSVITRDSISVTGIKINEINNYSGISSGSILYWRVKAFDSQGAESSWAGGTSQTVQYVSTAPSVPILVSPLSGATYFPTEEISWNVSSDNDAGVNDSLVYVLQLSASETFTVIIDSDTGTTLLRSMENLKNYASFIDNSSYYWRVNAVDNHGVSSGWSSVESFVLDKSNNAPTVPVVVQPVDSFVMFNDSLFIWKASTDPDPENSITYKIMAAKDSLFEDTVLFVKGITDTNLTLKTLNLSNSFHPQDTSVLDTFGFLDDRFYFWRVAAVDNRNASSAYTASQYFYANIVDDTPGVAYSLSPDFDAITFPTEILTWRATLEYEFGDTTKFIVETSLDSFLTVYSTDTLVEDTAVQLNTLSKMDSLPDETALYWRVKSIDIGGNSAGYSKIASLFYSLSNTAPTAVSGLNPNDSVQPLKPTESVSWNASSDLEKDSIFYDVYFSETLLDTSAPESLFAAKVNGNFGTSIILNTIEDGYRDILNNKVYFWRVRAFDEHNFKSSWTTGGLFRFTGTAPSTPANLVPSDSSELTVNGILSWSKCIDSDPGLYDTLRYVVDVYEDVALSTVISTDTIILDTSIVIKKLNGTNDLADDSYYYWTVKSMDVHGTISPSPVYGSFYFNRSNSAPNAPDSLSPERLTSRRPFQSLSWIGSDPDQDDTLVYRIELSKDTLFTIPLRVMNDWPQTIITIDTFSNYSDVLVHDSVYYWRVRATDKEGQMSLWSDYGSFKFDEKDDIASAPIITSPIYNEYVVSSSKIEWKNSNDPDDSVIVYHVDLTMDSTFSDVSIYIDSVIESTDSITSIKFSQLTGISSVVENKKYFLRVYPKSKVDARWVAGNTSETWQVMFGNGKIFDSTGLSLVTVIDQVSSDKISNIAVSVDSMVSIIFPDSAVNEPTLVKVTTVPILGTIIPPDSIQYYTANTEIQRLKSIVMDANKYAEGDKRIYYIKERAYIIDLLSADNPDSTVSLLDSVLLQIEYHDTNSNDMVDGDERIPVSALNLFRLNESTSHWEEVTNSQSIGVSDEGAEILSRRDIKENNRAVNAVTNHFSVYTILAKRDLTEPFGDFKVYPSPFKNSGNNSATITYKLTQNAEVDIRIYSRTGGLVWSKKFESGEEPGGVGTMGSPAKLILWDGTNTYGRYVGNGAYVVKIVVKPDNGKLVTKKQLLGVVK